MLDETKTIALTSPDGDFPPRTLRELHHRRWAHGQRGLFACSVEHLGINKYHVTVTTIGSQLILESRFTDFTGMRQCIAEYGFTLSTPQEDGNDAAESGDPETLWS